MDPGAGARACCSCGGVCGSSSTRTRSGAPTGSACTSRGTPGPPCCSRRGLSTSLFARSVPVCPPPVYDTGYSRRRGTPCCSRRGLSFWVHQLCTAETFGSLKLLSRVDLILCTADYLGSFGCSPNRLDTMSSLCTKLQLSFTQQAAHHCTESGHHCTECIKRSRVDVKCSSPDQNDCVSGHGPGSRRTWRRIVARARRI